ncbi:DUF742 domain-containing protein [Streptomyces sp. NPDC087532]|uniref:DUF742 domain-containing protein n=1 Tax=Streptomyces sp. NPDC087532 TaxID=3365795 RepID=UPI0038120D8B
MGRGDVWLRPAVSEVRPYGLTGGRTEPTHPLPLESVLTATAATARPDLVPAAALAVDLCAQEPRTVAELVGVLRTWDVPVQVVKVLLSDLIDVGGLELVAARESAAGAGTDTDLLMRVLSGMRKKWPDVRPGGGYAAA